MPQTESIIIALLKNADFTLTFLFKKMIDWYRAFHFQRDGSILFGKNTVKFFVVFLGTTML